MKKIALTFVSLAFATGAAMACPHGDSAEKADTAPRTAEKTKSEDKAKAKESDKSKDTAKAKDTKAPAKKADKVSQK